MVVDASVWVSSFLLSDVHHAASLAWLRRQSDLVTPTLALAEVAGAVARQTHSATNGQRAARAITRVPRIRFVDLDRPLAEEAARLAAQQAVRGADAVYIATASLLGLGVATWDLELQRRASGVVPTEAPR